MAYGNLKFDTLTTSDSLISNTEKSINTSYLLNGVAKATVSATLSGTIANSDSSLNISSIADGSTGLNTITVSSPFSAPKAAVPQMTNHDGLYARGGAVDDASASSFIVRMHQSGGGLSDDNTDHAITIHGDLA